AYTARLTEVDVAGQFPDDQDIQPRHDFRLEAGGVRQLWVQNGRTQIRKQAQRLAQAKNGLFRAQLAGQRIVLPVAHRAKQDRVGVLRQLEGAVGQRMTVLFV